MSDWIKVTDRLPAIADWVLFCCEIEDGFSNVEIGAYSGHYTASPNAIVMDTVGIDDWSPCSHWMPLPITPDQKAETK